MSEHTEPRCCGRVMTSIAVQTESAPLRLHSCPTCGRHAWLSQGAEVDRLSLLAALSVDKPARGGPVARPAARPEPAEAARTSTEVPPGTADDAVAEAADDPRRAELRALLSGFVVHGTSS